MHKKLLLSLICVFCVLGLANALPQLTPAQEQAMEQAISAAQKKSTTVIDYKFNPIVFKVETYFENFLYYYSGGRKVDATARTLDNIMAQGTYRKCYATAIAKSWVLIPEQCVYIEDHDATDPDYEGYTWSHKAKLMTFEKDGYQATVNLYSSKPKIEYIDGIPFALVNLDSICLSKVEKESKNVCMRFIDYIGGSNNGSFSVGKSYANIILSNINPSKYAGAFTNRRFFTPLAAKTPILISSVYGRNLIPHSNVKSISKALPGEPLYFKTSTGENVLVGVNADFSNSASKRKYVTFDAKVTAALTTALGKDLSGVKITDTLNIKNVK
jgi:hypothetical protein